MAEQNIKVIAAGRLMRTSEPRKRELAVDFLCSEARWRRVVSVPKGEKLGNIFFSPNS